MQVLNALLGWYEKIDHSDEYYLLKYASKLHILQVLSQWLSEHPGDFSAGTITRKNLYALISNIENDAVFAFSAKELLSGLDIVVEDCDAGAFRFGNDLDPSSPQEVHKQLMSTPTYDPALYSPSDTSAAAAASPIVLQTKSRRSSRNPAEDLLDAPPHHTNIRRGSADTLGNESWTHSTATTAIPGDALSSVTNLLAAQETETQKPTTKTRLPVTKEVTKVFLAVPEEEFANEITRMDWVMYSSMRLREMCRYVRTPLAKRSTDPGVQNVHQMVASFNHVAAFVVTMILSRDSPKARAKIMTKFINIACVSLKPRHWCKHFLPFPFHSAGIVLTFIVETKSPKQLQLARRDHRRSRPSAHFPPATNAPAHGPQNREQVQVSAITHGTAAQLLHLPAGVAELVLRQDCVPGPEPPRPELRRGRQQDVLARQCRFQLKLQLQSSRGEAHQLAEIRGHGRGSDDGLLQPADDAPGLRAQRNGAGLAVHPCACRR